MAPSNTLPEEQPGQNSSIGDVFYHSFPFSLSELKHTVLCCGQKGLFFSFCHRETIPIDSLEKAWCSCSERDAKLTYSAQVQARYVQ